MQTTLGVLFAPAEYGGMQACDLRRTVCVVFDVLRATSTIVTALGNGAVAILPVAEIQEALGIRKHQPGVLLAGEREGVRIEANLTGGVNFDLGNSPREFSAARVGGKTIAMTTTNGTRALRACMSASAVLLGSFLNLRATAQFIEDQSSAHLLLVCSGTLDQTAYEDVLGAGALCDLLWSKVRRRGRSRFRKHRPPALSPRTERFTVCCFAVPQRPAPHGSPGVACRRSLLPAA